MNKKLILFLTFALVLTAFSLFAIEPAEKVSAASCGGFAPNGDANSNAGSSADYAYWPYFDSQSYGRVLFDANDLLNPTTPYVSLGFFNPYVSLYDVFPGVTLPVENRYYTVLSNNYYWGLPFGVDSIYYTAPSYYPSFHAYFPDYDWSSVYTFISAPVLQNTVFGVLPTSQVYYGRNAAMTIIY